MQSLQSKLASGLLLSLIIAFSVLWLLVSTNVQFLAEEYIASRLKHDIETLLNSIGFNKNGTLTVDTGRIDLIYHKPFSGHYYVISTDKQSITSRSLWDQNLTSMPVRTGQELKTIQPGPEQQSLLLLSAGYEKQGHQLNITIAEDLNPINENINQFRYWFAAMAVGMLLILIILQIILLRKSLKPLECLQKELKSLQQGQLDKLNTDVPSELQPLVNEVNYLLEVTQQRLRRSRDALGDLAHAIKKPLTVIQQITNNNDIPETTRATLIKQADSIYQISDRILKRARLAGHSHSGALFSFAHDLPALIKTLDMMYVDKTLQVNNDIAEDTPCAIDREDMLELLGNLLDNAYKWAEKKVTLSADVNSVLHICIEDDGPGADPKKINALSQRGVRLDENIQGHGFGLAITSDIITDYHGKINFMRSDNLGGFRVDIELPFDKH